MTFLPGFAGGFKECTVLDPQTDLFVLTGDREEITDFQILNLSMSISQKGSKLIEQFAKSHGLLIPDALIAATALEYNIPLFTSNISDFRFIPGINLLEIK